MFYATAIFLSALLPVYPASEMVFRILI